MTDNDDNVMEGFHEREEFWCGDQDPLSLSESNAAGRASTHV
jgi:hypothetical protein